MMLEPNPLASLPQYTDEELAELNSEFDHLPAAKIIQWAVDNYAPHLCLSASMTDAVLIDLAVKVYPAIEVVFIDTGYHFPETLETVEQVRRRYGLNLRIMTVARQDEELWRVDPENCCSAVKVGQLDRALMGKAAWMSGLRRVEAASRGQGADHRPRPPGSGEGEPDRHVERPRRGRLHRGSRRPREPVDAAGLPVDRVHAVHATRVRRRRSPRRTVGGPRQDRMRSARLLSRRSDRPRLI